MRIVEATDSPHEALPRAFMWLTIPGSPPSSAIRITSETAATSPML